MADKKPDLGKNPFEAEIEANNASSMASVVVNATPNPRDLNNDWFIQQSAAAQSGIQKIPALTGSMELRFSPEILANKGPRELLAAVEKSEIRTFGWPIGITMQNVPDYRPRPSENGIKAEIAIGESELNGRSSYDYWALTRDGDFYLLQSFFEDMRIPNRLFFNTRIVRVTEALLFASSLYRELGFSPDTSIKLRVLHSGLKGRELASSSPNRLIFEKRTTEADRSEQTLEVEVGEIRPNVAELVRLICAPMFELFDFADFAPSIYHEIVGHFVEGRVS